MSDNVKSSNGGFKLKKFVYHLSMDWDTSDIVL